MAYVLLPASLENTFEELKMVDCPEEWTDAADQRDHSYDICIRNLIRKRDTFLNIYFRRDLIRRHDFHKSNQLVKPLRL